MDNLSPDQIKQMIAMLQAMLPENDEKQIDSDTKPQKSATIKTVSPRQVNKTNGFVNKFDGMTEARLHKEDKEIDRVLSVYAPTPRTRSFDPINVTCRVCGKKDMINPSMLSDSPSRYKCNNCARSPG